MLEQPLEEEWQNSQNREETKSYQARQEAEVGGEKENGDAEGDRASQEEWPTS